MSAPKSIDVESLIAQTRAGLEHPIPPLWPDAKKVMAFLCDAMEAMVGEVRASRAAESSLKSRLAAAEAERDRYKREVTDYEEREAACCPEDFGFDEVIASLRKRCAAAEAAAEMARQMLDRAASRLLSYGPKDVVGLEIRAHLASRPKAQGPAGGEVPRGQA